MFGISNTRQPLQSTGPSSFNPSMNNQDPYSFLQQWGQQNNIQWGNETNGTSRAAVDAMKRAGFNVDYETPDKYGRSAGIMLNGVPTKLWNGSGQLIVKPYSEAEPGSSGNGQGFAFPFPMMFGTGDYSGMQSLNPSQDPNQVFNWRRQYMMRQYQRPTYNTGGGYNPSQMNGGSLQGTNPQPGQMVSNGWGGMKPYDPNFTGVN